jgi:TRAP-type C4-dicarboxylate transport system substrate-binding protein
MKLLFFIDGGAFSGPISRNKAVRTVEDWKGLKIRAPGAVASRTVKAFGASAISMSGGEVYTALQRGTVDGAVGGYASMIQRKWYEVCKYFPAYTMSFSWFPQVSNLSAWNKLPKDIQKIMLDAGKEVAEDQSALAEKEIGDTQAKLSAAGLEGIGLPPDELARWQKISKGIWDEWAKQSPACARLLEIAESK